GIPRRGSEVRGRLAVLIALALAVGACTTTTEPRPESAARPAAPPSTAAPAAPPAPSKREALAGQYRARAEALEREGEVRRALDCWEIALAIQPEDQAARDGRAKLQARIEGAAAARISEARAALGRGAQVEARKRLLAALALDPGNRAAFTLL